MQREAELDLDSAQFEDVATATGIGTEGAGDATQNGAAAADRPEAQNRVVARDKSPVRCPRCNSRSIAALEKMATSANTCYRCHACGHIFSPSAAVPPSSGAIVQR